MEKQNKELLLKKIDELINLIKESSDYKKYKSIEEKMKDNKDIMDIISKIKKNEKLLINKKYKKEDISNLEKEIDKLYEELETYPIYQEYKYLQTDLNNEFQNIRSIIENSLNKINE